MTQQNMLYQQKFDKSAKGVDSSKNMLCQQKLAETTKCGVITQQNMLSKQKFAVSAKIS